MDGFFYLFIFNNGFYYIFFTHFDEVIYNVLTSPPYKYIYSIMEEDSLVSSDSSFVSQRGSISRDFLRAIPKTDLHVHLDG